MLSQLAALREFWGMVQGGAAQVEASRLPELEMEMELSVQRDKGN